MGMNTIFCQETKAIEPIVTLLSIQKICLLHIEKKGLYLLRCNFVIILDETEPIKSIKSIQIIHRIRRLHIEQYKGIVSVRVVLNRVLVEGEVVVGRPANDHSKAGQSTVEAAAMLPLLSPSTT